MRGLIVLVAQGFGAGRSPVAPGTFGTLVGLVWIFILLLPRSFALYTVGALAGVAAAIWIGGRAEAILELKDPGCIVIDEIVAMPFAFLPVAWLMRGHPASQVFLNYWIELALCFGLFRLFDVWKPGIIHKSQAWSGGLVVDDVLAGLLTGGVVLAWCLALRWN
jgi:phosphatidylglycerophosphatase A